MALCTASLLPLAWQAIRALSRQQGCTAFMTMLAGFQTMILHYTRQPDIVLGTDLANRTNCADRGADWIFCELAGAAH